MDVKPSLATATLLMRAWAIWAAVGLAGQACTGEIVRPLPKPAFSFELDGICHRSLPESWPTTTRVRTEEGRTTETTAREGR